MFGQSDKVRTVNDKIPRLVRKFWYSDYVSRRTDVRESL